MTAVEFEKWIQLFKGCNNISLKVSVSKDWAAIPDKLRERIMRIAVAEAWK